MQRSETEMYVNKTHKHFTACNPSQIPSLRKYISVTERGPCVYLSTKLYNICISDKVLMEFFYLPIILPPTTNIYLQELKSRLRALMYGELLRRGGVLAPPPLRM